MTLSHLGMKTIISSRGQIRRLKAEAYSQGDPSTLDVSGGCVSPVYMPIKGLPDPVLVGLRIERDREVFITLKARCRKCEVCMEHRGRLWAARACDEVRMSRRTWFGTLTLNADEQFRFLTIARRLTLRRQCEDFDELSDDQRFLLLVKAITPEVQKYLKRIRKASGARLRYLLVAEAHKSGNPHFHMLVHEVDTPVTKRVLDHHWKSGFTQWRLLPPGEVGGAFYACKYLAKSMLGRVKASKGYGTTRVASEIVNAVKQSQASNEMTMPEGLPVCSKGSENETVGSLAPSLGKGDHLWWMGEK